MVVFILSQKMCEKTKIKQENLFHVLHNSLFINLLKPPVTLRTTRLNIQKFWMVITLHLCVLYGS